MRIGHGFLDKVSANQMPPSHASKQPPGAQRDAFVAWIHAVKRYEAEHRKDTGDPGPVLARRLSNAEYNYTVRDLTGVDLQPAREFPVDAANQEGFDNSGESLTMSGALMKKYVQAAKDIADHMVLTSTGIAFATHPVLAETDRDKFCILRIVDFYKHQPTDYADYFRAAWRYQNRAILGMPNATLASVAADTHVSPRYLALVWDDADHFPLPGRADRDAPGKVEGAANADTCYARNAVRCGAVRAASRCAIGCKAFARRWRGSSTTFPCQMDFPVGGQCFVLYKDREYASHRMSLNPERAAPPPCDRVRRRTQAQPAPAPDPDIAVPQDAAARAPYLWTRSGSSAGFSRTRSTSPSAVACL